MLSNLPEMRFDNESLQNYSITALLYRIGAFRVECIFIVFTTKAFVFCITGAYFPGVQTVLRAKGNDRKQTAEAERRKTQPISGCSAE